MTHSCSDCGETDLARFRLQTTGRFRGQCRSCTHKRAERPISCWVCGVVRMTRPKGRKTVCSDACKSALALGLGYYPRPLPQAPTQGPPLMVLVARACAECGEEFTKLRPARDTVTVFRYCTKRCSSRASVRRREHAERGAVGTLDRALVLATFGLTCHLCGEETDPYDFAEVDGFRITGPRYPSLDHLVPLSLGGANTLDNVRPACFLCNSRRGARSLPEAA